MASLGSTGEVTGVDLQGRKGGIADQRGCVHQYEYDKLGCLIHDRLTTVGSGVDSAVLRLSSTYEVRGMLAKLTSWNNATVGSGSAVNEVQWTYNNFRQSIKTYQAHSGQVNTSTTANVQMGYANGTANTIRPTTLTYPNGRVLTYSYGTPGSISDASTQVASLIDSNVGATHLADYSYLGRGSVVQQDSPEASLRYTLISLTGTKGAGGATHPLVRSGWYLLSLSRSGSWHVPETLFSAAAFRTLRPMRLSGSDGC